jgi:hypothetical protein
MKIADYYNNTGGMNASQSVLQVKTDPEFPIKILDNII